MPDGNTPDPSGVLAAAGMPRLAKPTTLTDEHGQVWTVQSVLIGPDGQRGSVVARADYFGLIVSEGEA